MTIALKYFWIAFYDDGTALAQFDPETGDENLWRDVQQGKLLRVAWAEFSKEMRRKVGVLAISKLHPKMYSIELEEKGDKILICRRNHISVGGDEECRIEYILGLNGKEVISL